VILLHSIPPFGRDVFEGKLYRYQERRRSKQSLKGRIPNPGDLWLVRIEERIKLQWMSCDLFTEVSYFLRGFLFFFY